MSFPNPPRRRRLRLRYSDERIWREFYAACIVATGAKPDRYVPFHDIPLEAAELADKAYAQYRERFPVREPVLDDNDADLDQSGSIGRVS